MFAKYTAIVVLFWSAAFLQGVTLKEETKEAWETYLQERAAAMQARLQPRNQFLWLDEEQGRIEHVRMKGPYILPIGDSHSQTGAVGTHPRLARSWICPKCNHPGHFEDLARL
jgi:hypothetical protein